MGGLLHLVQPVGAWAGCGPAQSPPRCTKCNIPSITGQCTNFILFDVALWLPVPIKGLKQHFVDLLDPTTCISVHLPELNNYGYCYRCMDNRQCPTGQLDTTFYSADCTVRTQTHCLKQQQTVHPACTAYATITQCIILTSKNKIHHTSFIESCTAITRFHILYTKK